MSTRHIKNINQKNIMKKGLRQSIVSKKDEDPKVPPVPTPQVGEGPDPNKEEK